MSKCPSFRLHCRSFLLFIELLIRVEKGFAAKSNIWVIGPLFLLISSFFFKLLCLSSDILRYSVSILCVKSFNDSRWHFIPQVGVSLSSVGQKGEGLMASVMKWAGLGLDCSSDKTQLKAGAQRPPLGGGQHLWGDFLGALPKAWDARRWWDQWSRAGCGFEDEGRSEVKEPWVVVSQASQST